ncbi:MAG TPA: hypothetical protein VNA04_18180 [Thermoanaerobaculia bacterium]|nr:hypothetical protein [Thermoanaerobaculia bacterium]
MRIRVERTFLTTQSGTRVIVAQPESSVMDADSLSGALLAFIEQDGARLLGTIAEKEHRAVATAWKNRVYILSAEPAPD